jgi:TldD protein
VDDADLYLSTPGSEGWSLEEGIVKTGSFQYRPGVGVRAVMVRNRFAYSDDISEASCSMQRAPFAAFRRRQSAAEHRAAKSPPAVQFYADPPDRHAAARPRPLPRWKIGHKDPRIVQVMAGLAAERGHGCQGRWHAGRRRASRWCA